MEHNRSYTIIGWKQKRMGRTQRSSRNIRVRHNVNFPADVKLESSAALLATPLITTIFPLQQSKNSKNTKMQKGDDTSGRVIERNAFLRTPRPAASISALIAAMVLRIAFLNNANILYCLRNLTKRAGSQRISHVFLSSNPFNTFPSASLPSRHPNPRCQGNI